MNAWMIIAGLFGVLLTLGICLGLIYYVYLSIRRRSALGPGWDFDRDEQPILFWLQLGLVTIFIASQFAKLIGGIVVVARHLV